MALDADSSQNQRLLPGIGKCLGPANPTRSVIWLPDARSCFRESDPLIMRRPVNGWLEA